MTEFDKALFASKIPNFVTRTPCYSFGYFLANNAATVHHCNSARRAAILGGRAVAAADASVH